MNAPTRRLGYWYSHGSCTVVEVVDRWRTRWTSTRVISLEYSCPSSINPGSILTEYTWKPSSRQRVWPPRTPSHKTVFAISLFQYVLDAASCRWLVHSGGIWLTPSRRWYSFPRLVVDIKDKMVWGAQDKMWLVGFQESRVHKSPPWSSGLFRVLLQLSL